ncbi:MAG: hypothetical protein CMJ88_01420 [Planctomycetes bacterium]|nr:hypothetical protein [Planctomycetota bacterium]
MDFVPAGRALRLAGAAEREEAFLAAFLAGPFLVVFLAAGLAFPAFASADVWDFLAAFFLGGAVVDFGAMGLSGDGLAKSPDVLRSDAKLLVRQGR